MMRRLIFGRGEITDRLTLDFWRLSFGFRYLLDIKRIGHCFDLWLFPLHVCLCWHDPQQ